MRIHRAARGAAAVSAAALALGACGGGEGSSVSADPGRRPAAAEVAAGKALFQSTCATCHGPNGEGVPNLGKDMRGNEWIAAQSDAELVEFLKVGRRASDPRNVTGIDMPPKGGNASLKDEDLAKIVQFLRTL